MLKPWGDYIMASESLVQLRDRLNEVEQLAADMFPDDDGDLRLLGISDNDICSLPTFGGNVPNNTEGIFSWNQTSVLVPGYDGKWMIEDRNDNGDV